MRRIFEQSCPERPNIKPGVQEHLGAGPMHGPYRLARIQASQLLDRGPVPRVQVPRIYDHF